ncbi:hypothetical protein [Herbiconiux sp. UC225_62]|uniref:hypothetical protein n=1 Tax=Herbiconiux sp. UC225_62 TaxID=3350168 RepID=UPI0036D25D63
MAGFDVAFRFKTYDRELVTLCISAMRRRARKLTIRFESKLVDDAAWIALNGNTYQLDIYIERLRRDLPTLAEAAHSTRTPSSRRNAAAGLVEIITRYRFGAYDYSGEPWIPTLRALTKPLTSSIHEIYPGAQTGLAERMFVTMDLLASWHFGEVPAPVLIEEVHTASELLLKAALTGGTSRMTYAQLVGTGLEQGVFDYYSFRVTQARASVGAHEAFRARENEDAQLLPSLKDERRQAKHDGSGDAAGWLHANFWAVARVLEGLAHKARHPPGGADAA